MLSGCRQNRKRCREAFLSAAMLEPDSASLSGALAIDVYKRQIKALAFDVDGVLSTNNVYLSDDGDGQPQRTANIKDGYAMQLAVKCGLKLAIITGGRSAAVKKRYENLGVQNVFAGISVKIACFQHWLETENLKPEEVLYMGDDIPDYEVMRACGLPCCPADAAEEIKRISCYICLLYTSS